MEEEGVSKLELPFEMPEMDDTFIIAMVLAVIAEIAMFAMFKFWIGKGMSINLVTRIICHAALPFISYAMVKHQANKA
jgi:hypothetical protein